MNQQPLISPEAPIHGSQNLRVLPPEQLVGREQDLTAVHLALKAGTAVLLHGATGIGKTALAAHLAASYAELPGGVLWLDVNSDSFEMLVNRVARAYAPVTKPGHVSAAMIEAVHHQLHTDRPLLVLDGDFALDATREFIKDIAGDIPILLTAESMVAGPWTPHSLGALDAEASEAMLFHVGGASLESHMDQLPRLSAKLEGHPFSLYVVGRALAESDKTPDEFVNLVPDVPPGGLNQAMAAMMAAYRLLPAPLQGLVLLAGAMFADGASVELLADVSKAPVDVVRQTVRQVANHGFVREELVYKQPRFAVHELVKRFAQAFLQGKGQLKAMRERHKKGLQVYLQRALDTAETDVAYDRLALEAPTILAAAAHASEQGQYDFVQELIDSLENAGEFVFERGFQPELNALNRQMKPEPEALPEELPEAAKLSSPEPKEAIPRAELAQDVAAGAVQEAETPEEAAEPDVQDLDTALSPSLDQADLEMLEADEVDVEPVEERAVAEATEEETEESAEVSEIAPAAQQVGEYRADGSIEDELAAIEALAAMHLEQEDYEDALSYVDRGMKLAEEADNPEREAQLLVVLGDMQAMLGRYEGAELAYKEAIAAFRPTESWRDIALTLDKLGTLYAEYGRQPDAAAMWDQAVPIYEQLDDRVHLGVLLERLGTLHAQNFHWDQALKYYSQGLELANKANNKQAMFEGLWRLGRVLESSGARDGAQNFYQQALALAFDLGNEVQLGHTLLALGRIMMEDTVQLNRVVQLLEAAQNYLPDDTDAQRLLKRARTRQERLLAADITLLLVEDELEDYAKALGSDKPLEDLKGLDLLS